MKKYLTPGLMIPGSIIIGVLLAALAGLIGLDGYAVAATIFIGTLLTFGTMIFLSQRRR